MMQPTKPHTSGLSRLPGDCTAHIKNPLEDSRQKMIVIKNIKCIFVFVKEKENKAEINT